MSCGAGWGGLGAGVCPLAVLWRRNLGTAGGPATTRPEQSCGVRISRSPHVQRRRYMMHGVGLQGEQCSRQAHTLQYHSSTRSF
ncbi:hypothetical protein BS78_02G082700 [Paspalum vaginatum]|nr:hypothetical protein BS78_02G082700 [Paspalum vaginatum]